MVNKFCKLCLQPVSSADWKTHISQKQHLQQLPCKLVVKGPFKQDEIPKVFEYFMKFGGVRGQNVTNNGHEVCIEYRFWDAKIYSEIIHQEHSLFDYDVEISWYKKVKARPLQHVFPDEKMRREKFVYHKLTIIDALKDLPTFDKQLTVLQDKLKITKTQMETNRKIIYDELTAALASNFPESMIHFFGSSITELDIHDSNLNLYIDNTDSELATLELIKDQIAASQSFVRIFLNSESDPPVIKCEHKKTKVFCEVNIKNEMLVGISELIKCYCTLDEKLRPLMVLIKFWVDSCDLRGVDGLSSYAIYLMVLFYLQQEPYKLPSVADLQRDLPPDEVDGWNCTFGAGEFMCLNLEKATIFELMVGFFEFYSHFDYISKVISPYFGSVLEKACFLKPCDLPECFEDYISQDKYFVVNSGICIQDVFEHSKNVSLSNDLSCIGRFTAVCRNSLELVRSETKEVLYKLLVSNENLNQFSLQNQDFCDEHEWICLIKTLVLTILRKICCCDVGEKIEDTYIHYTCKGEFNIWDNRIESLKNLCVQSSLDIGAMNIIDKELAVTSHILNNCSKGATWKMVVSLKFYTDPCRVSVSFKEKENVPQILHIQHFVYVKLLEALKDKHKISLDNTNLEVPMTKASSLVSEETEDRFLVSVKSEESIGSSSIVTNPDRIEANDKERQELIKIENSPKVANNDVEEIISCDDETASNEIKKEKPQQDQIIIKKTVIGVDCKDIQVVTEQNETENLSADSHIENKSCAIVIHDDDTLKPNCKSEFAEENTISAKVEVKEPETEEVQTIINLCEPEDAPTLQHLQIVSVVESVKVQGKEKQHQEDEIIFVPDEGEDIQVVSDRNETENLSTGTHIENISCTNLTNVENMQKQNHQDTDGQRTGTVSDSKNLTGTQNLQTITISENDTLRVQVEDKEHEEDEIIWLSTESGKNQPLVDLTEADSSSDSEMTSSANENTKNDGSWFNNANSHCKGSTSVATRLCRSFLKDTKDGSTFSNQVVTFEKNLTVHRYEIMKKPKLLVEDLSTILTPTFPKITFDTYNTSVTGYNVSLHIYVDGVELKNTTLDSIERLISNSNKFTRVSRPELLENSIHAEHVDMHIPFELNVKNKPPLHTTQLIRHYMSLDHRISSLFTLIQCWNDMFDDKFASNSNNSILLMAIFYLQVVYKFSAVAELQVLDFPQGLDFSKNAVVNLKDTTVFDLVIGFFRFYDTFDYVTYVISPYFGSLVEKTRLLKPYDLPECYHQYMSRNGQLSVGSSIDIQDPFELYKNLTRDLSTWNLGVFIFRCRRVLLSLQGTQSLSFMMAHLEPPPIMLYTIEKKVNQKRETWFEAVKIALVKLLKDVMDSTSLVAYKADGVLFAWVCKGEHHIFQNRPYAAKRLLLPPTVSDLDKEIAITRAVNAQFVQMIKPWDLQLEVYLDKDSRMMTIKLKQAPPVPGPKFLAHFLYVHLKKALDEDIRIKLGFSQEQDYATTVLLANRLQSDPPTIAMQAATIRTTCYINKAKFEQNRNLIERDLKSALSFAFALKKIIFNFRLISSETLNIYIEIGNERNQSDTKTLNKIKERIAKSVEFSDIYLISEGIRCTHTKTEMICEINTTDKLSEVRSNLLTYYSSLDGNVTSLMYFVKFWADYNKLTGLNGFSSNAIYMMVIFFLQVHYKIPSVQELQHGAVQQDIDGWNCAFRQPELVNRELRDGTMRSLVQRFFYFYGNFDYISQVISPYLGRAVNKILFLQPHELLDSYDRYIKNNKTLPVDSSICVQDFFDHSKNVSTAYLYLCGKFATLCRISSRLILQNEENFFEKAAVDQRVLFTLCSDSIKDVQGILKKVFGCTVVVSDHSDTSIKYHCETTYDIWTKRIQCVKSVRASDPFNREVDVTSEVIKRFPQTSSDNFYVKITNSLNSIEIQFMLINDFPLMFHLCQFLYVNFLKLPTPEFAVSENVNVPPILNTTSDSTTQKKIETPVINNTETKQSSFCVNKNPSGATELNLKTNTAANLSTINNSNIKPPATVDASIVTELLKKNPTTFSKQVCLLYSRFRTTRTTSVERMNNISQDLFGMLKHKHVVFHGSSVQSVHIPSSDVNIQIGVTPLVKIHQLLLVSGKFTYITIHKDNFIKCVHCSTRQDLTITVKDDMALCTHKLISYYLRSNEKLSHLLVTLKHWAHHCNIIKNITGHMITLMAIFYLQVEHELPSVATLQKTTPWNRENKWNVGFDVSVRFKLNPTVFDLLKGFFEFYGNFDFFSMVVAPFCGTVIAKERFLKPFVLPGEYSIYKNQDQELVVDAGMCIQSPFEHTRNVADSVRYAVASTFAAFCRHSFERTQHSETRVLTDLLTHTKNALNPYCTLTQSANVSSGNWLDSVKKVAVKILTEVLGGEILQEFSNGVNCTRYKFQGPLIVLDKRVNALKKISKELPSDISFLDREVAITTHILQNSNISDEKCWEIGVQIVLKYKPSYKILIHFSGPLQISFCHFVHTRLLKVLSSDQDSKKNIAVPMIVQRITPTAVSKRPNDDFSADPAPKKTKAVISSEPKQASVDETSANSSQKEESNSEELVNPDKSTTPDVSSSSSLKIHGLDDSSKSSSKGKRLESENSILASSVEGIGKKCSSKNTQSSEDEEVKLLSTRPSTVSSNKAQNGSSSSSEIECSKDKIHITATTVTLSSKSETVSSSSQVECQITTATLTPLSKTQAVSSSSQPGPSEGELRSSKVNEIGLHLLFSAKPTSKIEAVSSSQAESSGVKKDKVPLLPTANTSTALLSSSQGEVRSSEVNKIVVNLLSFSSKIEPISTSSTGAIQSSAVKEVTVHATPTSSFSSSSNVPNLRLIPVISSRSTKKTPLNQSSSATGPIAIFDPKKAILATLKETQNLPSFTAQTSHFCSKLLLDEKTIETNRNAVESDVKYALAIKTKFDKVSYFGSSVTGLWSESGSFDIYVQKLETYTIMQSKPKVVVETLLTSQKFDTVSGFRQNFVKCKHKRTGIECHIYINKLPSCHSQLVEYYISLNPKLRQLFFVIKGWYEFNNVKEETSFSTYALYLMIIFYLQQEPYELPPVRELQKDAPSNVTVTSWNVAFIPAKFTSESLTRATIKDLVLGFFKFYATFDFYYNVIAPYYGSVVNKIQFLKPFDLPPCYKTFMELTPTISMGFGAWIQDPFQHTRCITDATDIVYVGKFSSLCRTALQLEHSTENQLLYRLITQRNKYFLLYYHVGVEIRKEKKWNEYQWMQTVKSVLLNILKDMLCCEIVKVEEKILNSGKVQTVNNDKSMEIEETTITCQGTREIWEDRIGILKSLHAEISSGSSCFDVDLCVSKVIMNDVQRASAFGLGVRVVFMRNPMSVRITVLDKDLLHFNHFIYTRMLKGLESSGLKEEICIPLQTKASPLNAICEPYKILVKGKFKITKISRVHDYFSNFGKIMSMKVLGEEKKLAVEYIFAEGDVYLNVIHKRHSLFGKKLRIIPLAPLKTKIPTSKFEDRRLSAVHSVVKCPTFEQQVNKLSKKVNAVKEKIETKYECIRDDFRNILSSKFPSCKVSLGSNITGVDIETYDLEVYVENVPTIDELITLKVMQKLIKRSENFYIVSCSSEGSDSFITCEHDKTRINCYLRIKNKQMESHRNLIQYYLSLDDKLPKFMLLLKFWADYYDLISAKAFSDSAIYLMAIFYLQQNPYKLPSVKDLQNNTHPNVAVGWNYTYTEILEFTNPVLKTSTILDLLTGFFRFYSSFDYVTYVISPYFGAPIQKVRFLKPYTLPKGFKQFRAHREDLNVHSGVFVQDFFDHSLNITSAITLDCMGAFTNLCRTSLQLLSSEQRLVLYKLLINVQRTMYECPEFVIDKTTNLDDQEWIQTVKNLTMKILSDVLGYKVLARPVSGVERTSFECVGRNVWDNRIKSMKTLAGLSGLRGIEKEVAVTTQVTIDFPGNVMWNLCLDLTFTKNPCSVKVAFMRKPGCSNVYHVCHYLYMMLVKFLDGGDVEEYVDVVEVEECKSPTPPPRTQDGSNSRNHDNQKIPTSPEPETVHGLIDLTDDRHIEKPPETSDISDNEIEAADDIGTNKLLEISDISEDEIETGDGDTNKLAEISDISEDETEIELMDYVNTDKQHEISDVSENEIEVDLTDEVDTNKVPEISDVSENEVSFESTREGTVKKAHEGRDSSTYKDKNNWSHEEEEEDDVPSDFFDDFTREDFLDGLEIVDDCDSNSNADKKILKSDDHQRKRTTSKSESNDEESSYDQKESFTPKKKSEDKTISKSGSPQKESYTPKKKSDDKKMLKSGRHKERSRSKSRESRDQRIIRRLIKSKSRSRSRDRSTKELKKQRISRWSSERKDMNIRNKSDGRPETRRKIGSRTPSPYTFNRRKRSPSLDTSKTSAKIETRTKIRSRTPSPCTFNRRNRNPSPNTNKTSAKSETRSKIRSRSPSPYTFNRQKRSSSTDKSKTFTKTEARTKIRSRTPSPYRFNWRNRNPSPNTSKTSAKTETRTKIRSRSSSPCTFNRRKRTPIPDTSKTFAKTEARTRFRSRTPSPYTVRKRNPSPDTSKTSAKTETRIKIKSRTPSPYSANRRDRNPSPDTSKTTAKTETRIKIRSRTPSPYTVNRRNRNPSPDTSKTSATSEPSTKIKSRTPPSHKMNLRKRSRSRSLEYRPRRRSSSRDANRSSTSKAKLDQNSTRTRSKTPSPHEFKRRKRSRSPEYRSRRRSSSREADESSSRLPLRKTKLPQNSSARIRSRSPSPSKLKRRKRNRSTEYRPRRRIRSSSPDLVSTKVKLAQDLLEEVKRKINEVGSVTTFSRNVVQPVPMSHASLPFPHPQSQNPGEVQPVSSFSSNAVQPVPMSHVSLPFPHPHSQNLVEEPRSGTSYSPNTVQPVPPSQIRLPFPPHAQNPVQIYESNFFIGTPMPVQRSYQQPKAVPVPYLPPKPIPHPLSLSLPVPFPTVTSSKTKTEDKCATGHPAKPEGKKISLADYLPVGANQKASACTDFKRLQEKVRVLCRCQDVIRFLAKDRRLPNRLKKPSPTPCTSQKNHQSPLKTSLGLTFRFTSPPAQPVTDAYSEALDKVLEKGGVVKKVDVKEHQAIDKVTEALETLKKALSKAADKC